MIEGKFIPSGYKNRTPSSREGKKTYTRNTGCVAEADPFNQFPRQTLSRREKKGIRSRHLTCGEVKTLRFVIQLLPFSLLCRNFGLCSFFGTFCRVFTACLSLLFCLLTKKPCLPLKNPDLFTQHSLFRDQTAKSKRAENSP